MKSIGSLYADTIKLKHPIKPVFEWGWSIETEEPFRESKVCLVFWVPFVPLGLAVGIWGKPQTEEAVYAAIGMREVAKFGNLPIGTKGDDVSEW
jgi:hypothetical protein